MERFEKLDITAIKAKGQFIDKYTAKSGNYLIKENCFILSTGSSAFISNIDDLNRVDYPTNQSIFDI